MLRILLPLVLLVTFYSESTAQRRSSDAILCSSIYFIVTSMVENNAQAQEMLMQQQQVFNLIYAASKNRTVTNGEISKLQHEHLMYLGNLYDKNKNKIYEIEMQCSTWRESFAPLLMSLSKTTKNFDELKKGIKAFPSMTKQSFGSSNPRWEQSKNMMDASFNIWSSKGRITPYSVKENLSESLKKD